MFKKRLFGAMFVGSALFVGGLVPLAHAAEEIDTYCVAPKEAVPHGSTVSLTIKFADSDKSNAFIAQGPFKIVRYDNGKAINVDFKRGNDKDDKGVENTDKPTLTFDVVTSPKHKLPAPATESVVLTYYVKHKEGKRGELYTTEREQKVDCSFVVQHEIGKATTPSGGGEDAAQKNIVAGDLGVQHTGILPTSRFYFLKEWSRGITRFFTFNAIGKAELELRITNEKAAEALTIQEEKPDDAAALENALENYTKAQERLQARLTALEETSENPRVEILLKKLAAQTLQHAALLNQLADRWHTDPYAEDAGIVRPEALKDNHLQGVFDIAQEKIRATAVSANEKDVNATVPSQAAPSPAPTMPDPSARESSTPSVSEIVVTKHTDIAGSVPPPASAPSPTIVEKGAVTTATEVPTNVSPESNKVFAPADALKSIAFRWTPLVPKPAEPVSYRMKVWQLMQGQSGSQAMKTNQPIVTKDVDNITAATVSGIYTGPCKPPYLCDFVWSVEALSGGMSKGTSDFTSFSVATETTSSQISPDATGSTR